MKLAFILFCLFLTAFSAPTNSNDGFEGRADSPSNPSQGALATQVGNFLKTIGVDKILQGVGTLIGNISRPRLRTGAVLNTELGSADKKTDRIDETTAISITEKETVTKNDGGNEDKPKVVRVILASPGETSISESNAPLYGILYPSKESMYSSHGYLGGSSF